MRLEGYLLVTRDIDASKDFYCRIMQAKELVGMAALL
ncbi:VOC family protein [Desulfovibrio sp. 1188_IL3213]